MNETPGKRIGSNLSALLAAHKKFAGNQSALGRALGVLPTEVNEVLGGRYEWPTLKKLIPYAIALECSMDQIVDGVEGFAAHRDLIRHESGAGSAAAEASPNGATAARVQELEDRERQTHQTLEGVVDVLVGIIEGRPKARTPQKRKTAGGGRHRTAHR